MTVTSEGQAANILFKGFYKLRQGQSSSKLVLLGWGAYDDMATFFSWGMDVQPLGINVAWSGQVPRDKGDPPSHW